jgi:hypothetical protein
VSLRPSAPIPYFASNSEEVRQRVPGRLLDPLVDGLEVIDERKWEKSNSPGARPAEAITGMKQQRSSQWPTTLPEFVFRRFQLPLVSLKLLLQFFNFFF